MNPKSKTILFFGTEKFSLNSLIALVENGYNIKAVITKPDARRGRKKSDTFPEVKKYALEKNIEVWQPEKIKDIIPKIKDLDKKPAGVLVSFGKIIPKNVIDLFEPGIINVHPSKLPEYRGPTPIETAILNGDKKSAVSIMKLVEKMDAGPVYSQAEASLDEKCTQTSSYKKMAKIGSDELIRVLPNILNGELEPIEQDDKKATYTKLLSKKDTLIDPIDFEAFYIERKIRAHLEFPKTKIPFYGQEIIITKANVVNNKNNKTIDCKNNTLLEIKELISPKSGKKMLVEDFLRGLNN